MLSFACPELAEGSKDEYSLVARYNNRGRASTSSV